MISLQIIQGVSEMLGLTSREISFLFLSIFFLTYLLVVGVEGYCCS